MNEAPAEITIPGPSVRMLAAAMLDRPELPEADRHALQRVIPWRKIGSKDAAVILAIASRIMGT